MLAVQEVDGVGRIDAGAALLVRECELPQVNGHGLGFFGLESEAWLRIDQDFSRMCGPRRHFGRCPLELRRRDRSVDRHGPSSPRFQARRAGLRAHELQGGAHPLLERRLGEGRAELARTTRLAGAETELAQARHHVPGVFIGNRP